MSDNELIGLRAKISVANNYLEQALRYRGKFDSCDIRKVVTNKMRPFVEVRTPEQVQMYGGKYVVMRESV